MLFCFYYPNFVAIVFASRARSTRIFSRTGSGILNEIYVSSENVPL